MSHSLKPLRSIIIIGDGLRAALPAAYLAVRCGGAGTRIYVVPSQDLLLDKGHVQARPNIRHLHQLLQIPEQDILGLAQGQRRYAMDFDSENGMISLPFGEFGQSLKGAGFSHVLKRLAQTESVKPLSYYNLNLRLHDLTPEAPLVPHAEFGYSFPREKYADMLRRYGEEYGVVFTSNPFTEVLKDTASNFIHSVKTTCGDIMADCVIDVRPLGVGEKAKRTGWESNYLVIPAESDLPGIELYSLQSSMEQMSDFMPDQSFNSYELKEYNRLSLLKEDRIADMRVLLTSGIDAASVRMALRRKVDVFSARGRIPTEDYEVFTSPEWHAALMGAGLTPRFYDRLADSFNEDELRRHIKHVDKDITIVMRGAVVKG